MSFLAPLFLAGLAALAVPVVVHLMQRDRRDAVEFPSLMFLQRIPYRSVRRQRIRNWPLFLLRSLAILLIVAAFARPFLTGRTALAATSTGGAREVVILLDRSYSMGYGDRWDRAKSAARTAVEGLGPTDRATLVTFSTEATALEPTGDRAVLHAAIDAARLGSGGTRYAPALRLARRTLDASTLPRREVVLITDFQRVGWSAADDLRLPARTTVTPVDLSAQERGNVAVTTVEIDRTRPGTDDREWITVTARLTQKGAPPPTELTATLELDGRALGTKPARFEGSGATRVVFDRVPLPDGVSRGVVRVSGDALPQDDAFHFTLSRDQSLSALIVEPQGVPASRGLYLSRALAIGTRPAVRADVRRAGTLSAADLEGRSLVILNGAPFPAGESGRRLRDMVRRGGGLLIATGERSAIDDWPAEAAELLPAGFGEVTDRVADRGGRLGAIDRSHPVFTIFGAPRSGDFAAARFFRYRPLEPTPESEVLARFDDGAVALAGRSYGEGRVLVWGSTLDNFWNDLALQPVFLPFVHQLARYAAGHREENAWRTVGESLDLSSGTAPGQGATTPASGAELVGVAPSGERTRIGGEAPQSLQLTEHGFYEIRRAGQPAGAARVVAVNVEPTESDLTPVPPAELLAALAPAGADSGAAGPGAVDLSAEEREARQGIWWYLLLAGLVLLGVETGVGNWISARRGLRRA